MKPSNSEKKYIKYRRSIYVIRDTKKNEILTKKNVRIIRPGLGMHPKYYPFILGKKAKKLKKGTALKKSFL